MELFNKLLNVLKKKNTIIIINVMLLLTVISMETIFNKKITIIDKEKEIKIETLSSKVDKALKKAGVTINEHDQIDVDMNTKLKDGMVIQVKRAFEVKINVDGKSLDVLTANNKVKDILKEYNIELDENDRTQPAFDKEIHPKDTIDVIRVEEKLVKEVVNIPYRSIITYSEEMEAGAIKKKRDGENGKKEVEYRIVYENGVEAIREIVNERIIKQPVDELIVRASEKYFVASRGQPVRYKKVLIMSATAYDLSVESCGKTPDHPEYGITRSGTKARPGVVAVDPRVIPLGTKLYVESLDGTKDYGFASAEDTGGAIKGKKIDLFMEDPKAVARYGRRNVRVYILD
ncbi:3D domain-containing protein [Paramaledivibacter caminithermalis]|jgi:uncharacterized protein YabE (DUF348 family)|uniref:G5 domain-containing protein n=1 Tax=Paramaledivibacter caminithermalis (strain DSM 15212 / CIP 107654 / DViRD3) TaxID=1121301 RepID=A0A1M6TTY5_PARC5|nr:3D domain-containing protein [Paramaledivibacter caminithermalis]SHK60401.1 protein of unknown function [Paramaledivibacter caminithermalis DSM 15212]